ncbi:lysophospholipase 1 precursor [Cantharellus anzutake]|uniref:lysophospholipase 1 precursor n=1 Tax=Cantharellus anzutake TaxID=1750568 RepID=UPI0019074B85|nr:lysophospholipase 1 precursor [Cantharellus anzutake]KAF8331299.1 lysophospholipase 1 precursor [Cantharellus anzutake]
MKPTAFVLPRVMLLFALVPLIFAHATPGSGTLDGLDAAAVRAYARLLKLKRDSAPATAPSGNYAPSNSSCPPQLIRSINNTVSVAPGEYSYVQARKSAIVSNWATYLNNSAVNLQGFDINGFLSNTSNLPIVAIAASGGGYRAMLHASGVFNAWDARNSTSVAQGTGGIVQLSTYMAGLSGGSWFVGTLAVNSMPMIQQLLEVWDLEKDLVNPGLSELLSYYLDINSEVQEKKAKGFDCSLTDYWGHALSRHLVNSTNKGIATTWSSVQNVSAFNDHSMPFPIIIADGRAPGETVVSTNTTIWEFTPYEFGSWDPSLRSFIPTEHIGTAARNGTPSVTNVCVRGFDNAGFVMGTSASLFNAAIAHVMNSSSTVLQALGDLLKEILTDHNNDIAPYPNTFNGINAGGFPASGSAELNLVDGATDNENIPLWPLLQPERHVDVILALDASFDTTYRWPNGSSLVQTRNRVMTDTFKNVPYPRVPSSTNTFVNRGLNNRTTFFGCNETATPLIVYVPNHPYTSYTNFSTFQLNYKPIEAQEFLTNALHEATGNGTNLPTCMACALIQRALLRQGKQLTPQCQSCFNQYCWDGVEDESLPKGEGWSGAGRWWSGNWREADAS